MAIPEDAIERPVVLGRFSVAYSVAWDPKQYNVKEVRPQGRRVWNLIATDEDSPENENRGLIRFREWEADLTLRQMEKFIDHCGLDYLGSDGDYWCVFDAWNYHRECRARVRVWPDGDGGDWEPLLRDNTWYRLHPDATRPFLLPNASERDGAEKRLWQRTLAELQKLFGE